tara:strand:+ start:1501 stop:1683 length:183 start_codon:yes stop_codon:yes gene_type:complete
MKTIKKNKKIIRVKDSLVDELLEKGWKFCPKQEWKKKVRDAPKPAAKKSKGGKKNDEKKS